jgi:5-methylcytosine-specific restriction endonuclease McrA
MTDVKICRKCEKEKEITKFSPAKGSRDGLNSWCKKCHVEYQKLRDKTKAGKLVKDRFMKNIGGNAGFYLKYKDSIRKAQHKYKSTPRAKLLHITREAKRRKVIVNMIGDFTNEQWDSLIKYYSPNHQCLCCGNVVDRLEIDHVTPITKEGTNYITNIQPLCRSCNASKNNNFIDYRHDFGLYAFRLMGQDYV